MKSPVIAIGLDAADPVLLEQWMAQGHLKTINNVRQQGAYCRLFNTVGYNGVQKESSATERTWVSFLSSCKPNKTTHWGSIKYDAKDYSITHGDMLGAFDSQEFPPFYAVGDDFKVAILDVPCTSLNDRVNGIQVLGWGGHFPHTLNHSKPAHLFDEIQQKYGKNPVIYKDFGYWWDQSYYERIRRDVKISLDARTEICRDLLSRDQWDLFLTVMGETHTVSHDFWHMSQKDHPLFPAFGQKLNGYDPMLDAFEQVDRSIAKIIEAAPEDAYVVLFAVHGMGNNGNDMYSMTFLPELLYRWNFPGKVALTADGKVGATPPPVITKTRRRTWAGEVWSRLHETNPIKRLLRPWLPSQFLRSKAGDDLISPYELTEEKAPLNWMPAMWYKRCWPKMKAFALPAFADGGIRINLKGRDRDGIVDPSEYDALCEELTQLVCGLRDARTGQPIVKEVARTRTNPLEDSPDIFDADLVIIWREDPTEVIDSPQFGRMGPVPYYRTGGHRPNGFLMVKGPGVEANQTLPTAQAVDIGPTILELMGAPIPDHVDGHPVVKVSVPV